jgi:hypothetical protein
MSNSWARIPSRHALARRSGARRVSAAGHGRRTRRALAVDGKAVRGTRHASGNGQAVHLLAAAGQQAHAVLARACVDGKTNEVTRFAPLLEPLGPAGWVITAAALHTQRGHAQFLVNDKKAPCILIVKKKNQPSLYAQGQEPALARDPRQLQATRPRARPRGTPQPSRTPHSPPGWPSRTPPRLSASPAGSGPCPAATSGALSRSTPSPA